MNRDKHEEYYNNLLLNPLQLPPINKKINFPECKVPSYDIIISRKSSTFEKDWIHWNELLFSLKQTYNIKVLQMGEYDLLQVCNLISKCKLFIGNDSGLAKISANLGIPTIQIFRWFTDCFVRCRVNGVNLIEPTLNEVLKEIL
jgi:hypothetical protein